MSELTAYVKMLLDGSAFCNWENKPSTETRKKLVESVFLGGREVTPEFLSRVEKVTMEGKNEEELKRMLDEMEIKEDDFLV